MVKKRKYRATLVDAHVAAGKYLLANIANNISLQPLELQERLTEECAFMEEVMKFMLSRRDDG